MAHHRKSASPFVVVALALWGCLDAPRLKSCAEFPIGTPGCPTACETWCDLMLADCPSVLPATGDATLRGCLTSCGEALIADGTFGATTGNSMSCRIEHARLAATTPTDHCRAASLEGGGTCTDARCDVYCEAMVANCAGFYPDDESCLRACEAFPLTPPGSSAEGTNSLECRVARARAAADDPAACRGAEPSGGGICGEPCDAYCDQIDAHCDANPVYPDRQSCEETCGLLRRDEEAGKLSGERNTVECRLYHATYPAAFDPTTHCPHTGVYHAAHCGPVCDTYCDLMGSHCPFTYAQDTEGTLDATACRLDCEAIVMAGGTLWPAADATKACLTEAPAGP